jgi:hypothetical protein
MTESFNLDILKPYLSIRCQVELSDMTGLNRIIGHIQRFRLESDVSTPIHVEMDLTHPATISDIRVRYYLGIMACKMQELGCKISFVGGMKCWENES